MYKLVATTTLVALFGLTSSVQAAAEWAQ